MIRSATPNDAPFVAPLMVQAMPELACKFIGSDNPSDAIPVFEYFFRQENNQYSYRNTLVYVDGSEISGFINAYDGADLLRLRSPFLEYLAEHGFSNFDLEPETKAGEFYLDTLSVVKEMQGRGIGSKLIIAMMDRAAMLGHQKIGLLAEVNNISAKKLYERLGFIDDEIVDLAGGRYWHMVMVL